MVHVNNVTKKNNELTFINNNSNDPVIIPSGNEVAKILDKFLIYRKCRETKFGAMVQKMTRNVKVLCKYKKTNFTSMKSLGCRQGFSNKRIIEKNIDDHTDLIPDNAIRLR